MTSLTWTRPDRALILLRYRTEALVQKSLYTLATIGFSRIDVAFGVGRDAVDRVELSRLPAAIAETRQDFQRVAQHDVDLLVRAVDEVDVLLLRIFRESNVPDRPVAQRALRDETLPSRTYRLS